MLSKYPVIKITKEVYPSLKDEPMGSKQKFWFEHPDLGYCLYKYIRPNTGEDWAEKIASELCNLLQLPHANYELAESWDGYQGTISVNFLENNATLIHGNEILTPLIPNYQTFATYNASHYTFKIVFQALADQQIKLPPNYSFSSEIKTPIDLFVGYLLLDTWIGNGDRHHENWGFVSQKQGSSDIIYLAPTYDHASSLGRELTDEKRQKRSVSAYAQKCFSAFYNDPNDQKPLKTFDLFCEVIKLYPESAQFWLTCLQQISLKQIDVIFESFPHHRISPIAADFAKAILNFNQTKLLSLMV
jgi:hypothetical protein